MKKTTRDFIATTVGLCLGTLFAVAFIVPPEEVGGYLYTISVSLAGYTWCLIYHSKVINNEEH